MKVVWILKDGADNTAKTMIDEQKKIADVTVVDMKTDKDYGKIIDLVTTSDLVISW